MTEDLSDLVRLIRSLQRLEGHPDCFGTAGHSCGQTECAWREYCLNSDGEPVPGSEEAQ
jgi:hypothetical protein